MRWSWRITGRCWRAAHASLVLLVLMTMLWPSAHAHSGKEVVEAICSRCHVPGTDGAPRIGDVDAWAARASLGLSNLTLHALQGIRKMPAHGGQPELTDLEIARAVTYMVNRSGGEWIEPASKAELAAERSGQQVVEAQCTNCHREGYDGAPKIGDLDAWVQRMKQGLGHLVSSAIHGHGGMPPRGGRADFTDAEIRSAILYMYYPAGAVARASSNAGTTRQMPPIDPNHRTVEGMDIYIGFMPVEKLRTLPEGAGERTMHGGLPRGSGYFHINVSLYDQKSHAPIQDARVQLEIGQPGLAITVTTLEPMAVGAGSYGSYLKPTRGADYAMTLHIDRPGAARTAIAEFEHRFE